METGPARWLLDTALPRSRYEGIDAVHAEDIGRGPGPCGIWDAIALDRALVTCSQELRTAWLPPAHPGVVILEQAPSHPEEIERNLKHLEFRLRQYRGTVSLVGNRFVVRADREVMQLDSDGNEVDLAPWRRVRIAAPAFAG